MKKQTPNLSIRRLIHNCVYILKFAIKISPKFYLFYMIVKIINCFVGSIVSVSMTKMLIDCVTNERSYYKSIGIILITFSIVFLTYLVDYVIDMIYKVKSIKINGTIQRMIFTQASAMDLYYYDKTDFYDDFIRSMERGESLIEFSISNIINVLSLLAGISGIISVVITIDPLISLLPVVACAINIFSLVFVQKAQFELTQEIDTIKKKKEYFRKMFYQSDYAKEMKLTSIRTPLIEQFESAINDEIKTIKKYGKKEMLLTLIHYIFGFTFFAFYISPLYMAYHTLVTNNIELGQMSTTYKSNLDTFHMLRNASSALMKFQYIGLFAEQFREFMEYTPDIENTIGCTINNYEPQTIEIIDLSFKYDDRWILRNINIKISPGEKIAIVGNNGAGKSTLIKLLLRLYDPTEGCILYGGKDIREYDLNEYRKLIGIVLQNFQIYPCSVRHNVTMGYLMNDELIDDSLKKAGLYKKINNMTEGLDTILDREFDDNGMILSGGEKQKIALARLFAKAHLISILDEPSSALDPIAEYETNKKMIKISKDNTVILISHRLSTTRCTDQIYLLKDGRIIEKGSHEELISLNGEYAEIFRIQAKNYLNTY